MMNIAIFICRVMVNINNLFFSINCINYISQCNSSFSFYKFITMMLKENEVSSHSQILFSLLTLYPI